ncbi:MAG: hypothetical protein V5A61_16420 [Haloarculaceae archaeon]
MTEPHAGTAHGDRITRRHVGDGGTGSPSVVEVTTGGGGRPGERP